MNRRSFLLGLLGAAAAPVAAKAAAWTTAPTPYHTGGVLSGKPVTLRLTDYQETFLREVAKGLHIDFDTLSADYGRASYSAARQAMDEVWVIERKRSRVRAFSMAQNLQAIRQTVRSENLGV